MLEFARAETASHTPLLVKVLLEDAVRDAKAPQNVNISMAVGDEVVTGDSLQLRGVLRNLLTNAVQAMDGPGDIHIGVERSEERIQIRVIDTGPGIEETKQDEIFEPLVTTRIYGLGLGLAYSRRVVEGHGGTLWAQADPGGGACFILELPAV